VGAVVLDAGVVIALIDVADPHHVQAVARFRDHRHDELVMPASVYAEVLVRPARLGRLEETRHDLLALGLRAEAIGEATAEAAARLRARFASLRLPDALVLGHAEAIGADVVLTTDRRWRALFPSVRLVG
jgi:predicted nucleic acid-binding protein